MYIQPNTVKNTYDMVVSQYEVVTFFKKAQTNDTGPAVFVS